MTARSWRHFSVHWTNMVAGLIGLADPERHASLAVPPVAEAGDEDAACDADDDYGREDDEEVHQPIPAGNSTGNGTPYNPLFCDMPVQDAEQETFCQAALLGGMLMSDNKRDTVHRTAT